MTTGSCRTLKDLRPLFLFSFFHSFFFYFSLRLEDPLDLVTPVSLLVAMKQTAESGNLSTKFTKQTFLPSLPLFDPEEHENLIEISHREIACNRPEDWNFVLSFDSKSNFTFKIKWESFVRSSENWFADSTDSRSLENYESFLLEFRFLYIISHVSSQTFFFFFFTIQLRVSRELWEL